MIINEKYFKQYSPIPLNFSMAEIKNYIPVAEKIWVRPLIGYDLFDELEYQVMRNMVSEKNATLLTEGGLWQFLAFATVYEALPILWSRITEIGIVKGKTDTAESLSLRDMTYVQTHIRNQVEVLKEQVKKWICEHYLDYPLADVCACNCNCCQQQNLDDPNPNYQIYTNWRKCTKLR